MAFSPQFLDELKARVGLAEVVGRRVRLVKKGREHSGLCPFHNEKTPSFTVNEEKGFYHCFGCGAHGSAFDFVMETEGLSFPETVERLAADVGLEVPVETPEERVRNKQRQSLYDVTEAAAGWFEKTLRQPEGRNALDYLKGRGLSEETIKQFRLGFAPDSRGALKAALGGEGISEALMVGAGMLIRPEDAGRDTYDRFRGRVMFPITDRQGRVIAFGGRILGDGEPKYLNSPETALFHKGLVLYGLAQAAPKVHKSGRIVVSEGYMDVIALHQAGLDEAVAPLGTALTEDHLRALWRLAREPILCFDGDAAGQRAAGRAVERALALLTPGHSLRLATLPAGEDPDSLIKSAGAAAMERVLELAVPLSEALWRIEIGSQRPETPEDRAWLEEKLKRQAARITDETVRRYFLNAFRDRLWQEFRAARRPGPGQTRAGQTRAGQTRAGMAAPLPTRAAVAASAARAPADLIRRREAILLAVLINHPDLSDDISERLGLIEFSAPELDNLRQEVLKTLAGKQGLDRSALNSHLVTKGFSEELKGLLGPRVVEHAFFARPGALPEMALLGWEETYSMYRTAELKKDLREAKQQLADGDSSRETYDRFLALKSQEDQLIADQMERERNYPDRGRVKE